jgi:transposase
MIPWERRVILKHYLDQGVPITALATQFGIGRRTIHRWISTGQLDRDLEAEEVRYKARPPKPCKLDPFKPLIHARLDAYPALTAVRLFEEIRGAGYTGGITRLREYLAPIRPRSAEELLVRFETAPGQQAQVDFARFQFPWGVRYALLVVLGYSRLLWLGFSARQDMRALMGGLEEAFRFFGGVPRELLFDQMRSVISRDLRLEGGRLIENAEFLRFARHWGFTPRACRPYRAKTKGKVERPIRYLRESFVYGRDFLGDADLEEQAHRWLEETANVRLHRTTGERPAERFLQERTALLALAERPYRSLVLPAPAPEPKSLRPLPRVQVERRPLRTYAQIAAGAL